MIAFNRYFLVVLCLVFGLSNGFVLPDTRRGIFVSNNRPRGGLSCPLSPPPFGSGKALGISRISINNNNNNNSGTKDEGDNKNDDGSSSGSRNGKDGNMNNNGEGYGSPICRIVTRADSKLPATAPPLPTKILNGPFLLRKLDAYYQARAHQQTQSLKYMDRSILNDGGGGSRTTESETTSTTTQNTEIEITEETVTEEKKLVSTLRTSLEDAGFQLLSRRDIDLCEALNAGYLLRLSILPDVTELDPKIAKEFYPEKFLRKNKSNKAAAAADDDDDELLFEGRVLVFWRGYSNEVTKGRLLLPKLDYLQASLVQRSAAWLKSQVNKVEIELVKGLVKKSNALKRKVQKFIISIAVSVPAKNMARWGREVLFDESTMEPHLVSDDDDISSRGGSFSLGRYGGSKIRFVGSPNPDDAMNPFTICEIYNNNDNDNNNKNKFSNLNGTIAIDQPNGNAGMMVNGTTTSTATTTTTAAGAATIDQQIERDMYQGMNYHGFTCEYDEKYSSKGVDDNNNNNDKNNDDNSSSSLSSSSSTKSKSQSSIGRSLPSMQLIQRVSIGNLVDIFSKTGRKKLLKTLFRKSELVEPTYEEVVVVWRPLVKKKQVVRPPRFVSEFADMVDIEGFEQPTKELNKPKTRGKIQIRTFEDVPMSNLQAVFPKTKLIFRPQDAFLFDMISFVTFLLVVSSIKLDSPKLDILALVSVSLWTIRTVIRYSNKLARYDLLVKKFLTSKISHRNAGAVKYITSEAGSQRAIRAALVQSWILNTFQRLKRKKTTTTAAGDDVINGSTTTTTASSEQEQQGRLTKQSLRSNCKEEVNKLLGGYKLVGINADRALEDLEELELIQFEKEGQGQQGDDDQELVDVKDPNESIEAVRKAWVDVLDDTGSPDNGSNSNSTGSETESMEEDDEDEASATAETSTAANSGTNVMTDEEMEMTVANNFGSQQYLLEEFEDQAKRFTASLEAAHRHGYVTAMQIMKDKGAAQARAAAAAAAATAGAPRRRRSRQQHQHRPAGGGGGQDRFTKPLRAILEGPGLEEAAVPVPVRRKGRGGGRTQRQGYESDENEQQEGKKNWYF